MQDRILKFRAWFPCANVMGLVTNLKGSNQGYEFDGVVAECFINGRQVFYEAYRNFTLMQYTGLKDKNGVEIYEGDIIKWKFVNTGEEEPGYTETVEWSECGFFLDGGAPLTVAMDDCEVIGNIFQPPIDKEPIK